MVHRDYGFPKIRALLLGVSDFWLAPSPLYVYMTYHFSGPYLRLLRFLPRATSLLLPLCTPAATATTWTPRVCKIISFMAVIMDLGLLFYILLGFR